MYRLLMPLEEESCDDHLSGLILMITGDFLAISQELQVYVIYGPA